MSKYHSRPADYDGFHFDSQAELARYHELKLMERNGDIDSLTVHPVFPLMEGFMYQGKKIRGISYEADFSYYENGEHVVEDVKGVETEGFKLKSKLFKARYSDMDFRVLNGEKKNG
ncbi:MAG: DUF1064 domain-containing protein [Candidatus Paceibacterota bacterium]|jgi:hypothetical protein